MRQSGTCFASADGWGGGVGAFSTRKKVWRALIAKLTAQDAGIVVSLD